MQTPMRALATMMAFPLFAFTGNKPDTPDLPKPFRDGFATVPSGMLTTSDGAVEVKGFMISSTEVSNAQYMEFIRAVRATGDVALLSAILPDTAQWVQMLAYGEPFNMYYHSHPAYANYPVVNVGRDGALAYCAWLEDRMNKEAGVANKYEVRLPERNEWWYAANGG